MKIKDLLDREPFGAIFEETLSRFFSAYLGRETRVGWRKRGSGAKAVGDVWYCNPALNAVVHRDACEEVRRTVWGQYATTPFLRRRLAQKAYVTLATGRWWGPALSAYEVHIAPGVPDSQNLLICGGNSRIRVIDVVRRRTWDVLKAGFPQALMDAELGVRQSPNRPPVPNVSAVAEDRSWFEAEFVQAVSLNRLPPENPRLPLLEEALRALGAWLELSLRDVDVGHYVAAVERKLQACLLNSPRIDRPERVVVEGWVARIKALVTGGGAGSDSPGLQLVATGHGDFQEGNILVGRDGRVWIVDWECSAERQVAYDFLVLGLRSRFPAGLGGRVQKAVESEDWPISCLPWLPERVSRSLASRAERRRCLAVFLLEELEWALREISNPLFCRVTGMWPGLRSEMEACVHFLETTPA